MGRFPRVDILGVGIRAIDLQLLMSTPAETVSIIIRCFNEERHIGTLLEEVFRQTVHEPQVIVVDSGSTDGTLGIVARFPVRLVRVRPADFTFGYSLNQGCRVATGAYLAIASAHVVPCGTDWLRRLIEPFADPKVALVYGRQVGDERTRFSEHQLFAKQYPPQSNLDQPTPFCNNANAADPAVALAPARVQRGAVRAGGSRLGQMGGRAGASDRVQRRSGGGPHS